MRSRPTIRTWCASGLGLLVLGLFPGPSASAVPEDPAIASLLDRAADHLKEGDFTEAQTLLGSLPERAEALPRSRYLRGWLRFAHGDYTEAARLIRSAVEADKTREEWKPLRDLADAAREITSGYVAVADRQGRFTVRHPPGKDRVLAPYALKTLEAQAQRLTEILGSPYPAPVMVEILPDVATLAILAEIDPADAERTGTVAVSHLGRILILSPAALDRGYPWLDTLGHELAHLWVTRMSRDRAPGWLHEGLARLLQSAWTGGEVPPAALTPVEEYLLDMAAREGRLIPLSRLGLSLLRLPSQEEAVLALSQSASFTGYLAKRKGPPAWIEILGQLREGQGIADAVQTAWKSPYGRVVAWWMQSLKGRHLAPPAAVRLLGRRFKKGTIALSSASLGFQDPMVTRKLRVADLLSLRGHVAAAAAEYRQAADLVDDPDPIIANKLARCEILLGQPDKAILHLAPIAPLYPHVSATFAGLGEAYRLTGQPDLAARALRQSLGIDPFDRQAVCGLADILKEIGTASEAKDVARHCETLATSGQGATESSDPAP